MQIQSDDTFEDHVGYVKRALKSRVRTVRILFISEFCGFHWYNNSNASDCSANRDKVTGRRTKCGMAAATSGCSDMTTEHHRRDARCMWNSRIRKVLARRCLRSCSSFGHVSAPGLDYLVGASHESSWPRLLANLSVTCVHTYS